MARAINLPGAAPKPDFCNSNCPVSQWGNGFVSDHVGRSPKLAFIQPGPTAADAMSRKPMTSYKGLFYYAVLKPNGLTWDDVILSHCLRCYYSGPGGRYPVGRSRSLAELSCRSFDSVSRDTLGLPNVATGLRQWNPNLFFITYDMNDARTLEAYQSWVIEDTAKAVRFAERGYRPLVAMGLESMELIAPWLAGTGGLRKHRGDWFEGTLPWGAATPRPTFNKALVPAQDIIPVKRPEPAKQLELF